MEKYTVDNFDEFKGYTETKTELANIVSILNQKDKFKELGATLPSVAVLIGDEYIGKTTLAKYFANACNRTFKIINPCTDDIDENIEYLSDQIASGEIYEPEVFIFRNLQELEQSNPLWNKVYYFFSMCRKYTEHFIIATSSDMMPQCFYSDYLIDYLISFKKPTNSELVEILEDYFKDKQVSEDANYDDIARIIQGNFNYKWLERIYARAVSYAVQEESGTINQDALIKATLSCLYGRTKVRQEELKLVAAHEAAHCLVAEILNPGCSSYVTAMEGPNNDLGIFSIERTSQVNAGSLLDDATSLLAGRAGEELVSTQISSGAGTDIQSAYKSIEEWITRHGCGGWRYVVPEGSAISQSLLHEKECLIADKMEELFERAKTIISDNQEYYNSLRHALEMKGVLTHSEIIVLKPKEASSNA